MILKLQFEALRDGDRFWYQRNLSYAEQRRVERTSLADIIRRNTRIGDELHDDVFTFTFILTQIWSRVTKRATHS